MAKISTTHKGYGYGATGGRSAVERNSPAYTGTGYRVDQDAFDAGFYDVQSPVMQESNKEYPLGRTGMRDDDAGDGALLAPKPMRPDTGTAAKKLV
jgi:hypothetical protein